jgi:TetR/AcrR family transcriptional regulator
MVKKELTSEEKILTAARQVFHKRGFEGARMQEIADTAGTNKALVHYYFRNKENLFAAVFSEAIATMIGTVSSIFMGPGQLEEKLERFYDFHISFLQQNSYLPWFIINGLHERPEQIKKMMSRTDFHPERILEQVMANLKNEGYEVEDPLQVFTNILSLSIFPIVAQPMLSHIFNLSEKDMEQFYQVRKKKLARFVINGITLRKTV